MTEHDFSYDRFVEDTWLPDDSDSYDYDILDLVEELGL